MGKDKISIITNSLSLGGAERVSLSLAECMSKDRFEVFLITLNKDREEGYDLSPSIRRIAINKSSNYSKFKIIKELRRKIKHHKINKILVMGIPLAVFVIPATFGLNVKVILSERNDPSNFHGKTITRVLSRFLMQLADGFIFQTEGAKQYYSRKIQEKSTIIPNPLLSRNLPPVFEGVRKKSIVTAGRLVPQKNHKLLIRAFKEVSAEFSEYTLTIFGNGSERENLQTLIYELDLFDKVKLPGATKKLFDEITDAEMFVLSSDFEGMPNALIEAMALGLPCISTDCPPGGPRSLIENEKNGILVQVNDYLQLAESIKLLIQNKELSNRIASEAIKIRSLLSIDIICKRWIDYVSEVDNI